MRIEKDKVIITREEMSSIKNMNRRQLEEFLKEVLVNTDTPGIEEVQKRYMDAIEQTLSELKGIGEKRKELFLELFNINIAQP